MTDLNTSAATSNPENEDEKKAAATAPSAQAKPNAVKKITVKLLRNINPGPEADVPKSEYDVLGRIVKGKVIDLPAELARKLIKAKIASADAAFD